MKSEIQDKAYWDQGRAFLTSLVESKDEKDQEIVSLLVTRFDDNWEAAIGTLIQCPNHKHSFMRLIMKKKYRRAISELRKLVAKRKKEQKRARLRKVKQLWIMYFHELDLIYFD